MEININNLESHIARLSSPLTSAASNEKDSNRKKKSTKARVVWKLIFSEVLKFFGKKITAPRIKIVVRKTKEPLTENHKLTAYIKVEVRKAISNKFFDIKLIFVISEILPRCRFLSSEETFQVF